MPYPHDRNCPTECERDHQPERPQVIPATEHGGYLVASKSRPGAFWMLTVDRGVLRCPCERGTVLALEDGDQRSTRFCRHGQILVRWIATQDQANRRPSAPANISALVD